MNSLLLDRATDEQIEKKYLLWNYATTEAFGGELSHAQIRREKELRNDDTDIDSLRSFSGGFWKFAKYYEARLGNNKEQGL